jgi:uncharacterized protein (TIGR02452 family)
MSNKLQRIAEETLAAIDAGKYINSSGKTIPIKKLLDYSIKGSRLYKPDSIDELTKSNNQTRKLFASPKISITSESSLEAAFRLANEHPCLLNFASAKHAGGGFLRGSAAQEESIARSSGLYPTLIQHPEFYEENKRSQAKNIGLYLDYAIYSPEVPIFRNDAGEWLEAPYVVSVLTSPAPNRHAILNTDEDDVVQLSLDDDIDAIEMKIIETLDKRMYHVLSIMAAQGHRTIILGAWGCGIFGNDPLVVAELFRENLQKLPFFDTVVFAIYDKPDSDTVRSFVQIFGN